MHGRYPAEPALELFYPSQVEASEYSGCQHGELGENEGEQTAESKEYRLCIEPPVLVYSTSELIIAAQKGFD